MNALGNLLRKAGRIVPREPIQYRTFNGNVTNDIGNIVSTYSEWHEVMGHAQPGLTFSFNARGVSDIGEIAKRIGIDQAKKIITVFVYNLNLKNVHDHDTPDQIKYKNCIYNIWSISNWFDYDGWQSLICIEDTREREPVVYTTDIKVQLGGQILTNPLSRPFLFTDDIGNKNDMIVFLSPYARVDKKTSGWKRWDTSGARYVPLDREVQPHESVVYTANAPFTLTWGADE